MIAIFILLCVWVAVFRQPKGAYYAPNLKGVTRFGNISSVSLHAEMHALLKYLRQNYKNSSFKQKFNNKKNNSTVYVVRIMNNKQNLPLNQNVWFGNCKPCTHCQKYLIKFGFKKIKYTDFINNQNYLCELQLS